MNSPLTQNSFTIDANILSISELNRLTKQTLEKKIGSIWLTGEVSNLSRPSSGHTYFSLKDKQAQIRCAMFRNTTSRAAFTIENGQSVLVQAKVTLYEARGDYQIIVNSIHLSGHGLLQLQFEQLKNNLSKKGWFDDIHKKPLPKKPCCIGVITSPTGAAIRDVLTVLKRRYPIAPVIIYPCQVQGQTASRSIIQAIESANNQSKCDALILTRGGGSLEDLWCFNSEELAHCIKNSRIPTITGIGHEVDVTIADLVADHRASTPSSAAEFLTPDQNEWLHRLLVTKQSLIYFTLNQFNNTKSVLQSYRKRLRHPNEQLQLHAQKLDQAELHLTHTINTILKAKRSLLTHSVNHLNSLNPLSVLERGYSICFNSRNQIVNSFNTINKNDSITIQFKDGLALAVISSTKNLKKPVKKAAS